MSVGGVECRVDWYSFFGGVQDTVNRSGRGRGRCGAVREDVTVRCGGCRERSEMRRRLQLLLPVLWAAAWAAGAAAAAPACVCAPAECEPVRAAECPGGAGTVWDACGCCRVCARAEAQPCGGPYGFYGACGPGLLCVLQPGRPPLRSAEGVCTRPPSLEPPAGCPGAAVRVSGCNVVERRCQCALAAACPGERPFAYSSYGECQLNLDYLLANELAEEQQGLLTTESPGSVATPGGR